LHGAAAALRDAPQPPGRDGGRLDAAFAAGAALSLDEAVAEARQAPVDGPSAQRDWSSLTETEQQVAALAAEGLTNPEIAGVLFLSLGTVKAHLAHVFRKLEITRRRELARALGRRPGAPATPRY
jgi:DNA-binding NarL/FixJ family response regulator